MAVKKITPNTIKSELKTAITWAIENENREFGEQEYTFVRNRVLTAEIMVDILLSIQGGSLDKELYEMGVTAKKSAFVQRRKNISYTVFEDI